MHPHCPARFDSQAHVVAWSIEQLLQGDLHAVGARTAPARADHLQAWLSFQFFLHQGFLSAERAPTGRMTWP